MKSFSFCFVLVTLAFTSMRFGRVEALYNHPFKTAVREEKDQNVSPHDWGRRLSLEDLPFASFKATKDTVDPKLGTELTALYENYTGSDSWRPSSPSETNIFKSAAAETEEYISVDITFKSVMDNVRAREVLKTAGLDVDFINCFSRRCSTRIPVSALKDIASIDAVQLLHPVKARTLVGSVTSEGDRAVFANIARSKYSVNGTGILIGAMSDSYNCLRGAFRDMISGDLPRSKNSIVVLADLTGDGCVDAIDEGRAMMQLIHDVAPAARLAYRTAYRGEADFAAGILELAAAGCDIIVDDVTYEVEPMFQDGIIAQAVNQVVSQGVSYFSAAGNGARGSWEAPSGFRPVTVNSLVFHQFGTDRNGSPILSMRININSSSTFVFQWDEPYASVSGAPGSRSDLDVYFVINDSIVAHGEDFNVGRDPVELFYFNPSDYSTADAVTVEFFIIKNGGPPPSYMKLLAFSYYPPIFEFATDSSTLYGHMNAAEGAAVGAANFTRTPAFGVFPPEIEWFSSPGGTPVLLATNGTRLLRPEIRNQPRFTGPDGVATTFFRRNVSGVFRFYGTSASAPQVAAVAALMLQYKGGSRSLTPAEVYSTLAMTSIDMDDPFTTGFDVGFDFGTGAGFVNASAALLALMNCTITYNLYNSRRDALVAPLTNGTIMAKPPSCGRTNIEAVVPCAQDGVVTLELFRGSRLAKRTTQQVSPYFLFGHQGSNVYGGRIRSGRYGIRARVKGKAWSPFTNFTMGGRCG